MKKSKEMISHKSQARIAMEERTSNILCLCVGEWNMFIPQHMKLYAFCRHATFPKLEVLELLL